MKIANIKTYKRERRHRRIRAKVSGTAERPRLSVFRSNKFMYAQLIDDVAGRTLAASHSMKAKKGTALQKATEVGVEIAAKAKALKVTAVVFDRGGYIYAGKIKAVAEAARAGGLTF